MSYNKICKATKIDIQGEVILVYLYVMSMVGESIVLETEWLKKLGLLVTNNEEMSMSFCWKGRTIAWQGEPRVVTDLLTIGKLKSLKTNVVEAYMLHFELYQEDVELKEEEHVIDKFSTLFKHPSQLPPKRNQDNFIHLQNGSQPNSLRPYRYP